MDRFNNEGGLYANSNISSYDPGHVQIKGGGKKDEDNVLLNTSIKKVMQRNRELHKQVVQLQIDNKKIEKERDMYKKKYDKLNR